jgi:lysozyme
MNPLLYGVAAVGALSLYSLRRQYSPLDYGAGNVPAFLAMLREYESGNDYSAYVYGDTFRDFSDHPINTGEKSFVARLDDGRPTSAAGAYQITSTTWAGLKRLYGFTDFRPESQDAAAISLIRERGAYADIYNGNFDIAVGKLAPVWECLSVRPRSALVSSYQLNGGQVS